PLLAVAEVTGHGAVSLRQSGGLERMRGADADFRVASGGPEEAHRRLQPRLRGQPDAIRAREPGEEIRGLVAASDSDPRESIRGCARHVFAAETDLPAGRSQLPGEQVQERRLPGPVRSDHGVDAPLLERYRNSVDGCQRAEAP